MALRNDINAQVKADLINFSSAIDGQAYVLLGENAMGDRTTRIYFYDIASNATVDGDNVLAATGMGGTGRFIKNPIEEFNTGLATVATSGDYNDLINTPSVGSPSASIVSRSFNSSFQLTENTIVNYSVSISVTSTLLGTNSGTVFLETSSDNSTWTVLPGQVGLSISGVASTVITTVTVGGYVQANHFVRIRTATSGANGATFTYITGQEIQL